MMGASPAVNPNIGTSVRKQAEVNAKARADEGELVHISNATGAKVKLPGTFKWVDVGPEGISVHQGAAIRVDSGGRATLHSQSRGRYELQGGRTGRLQTLTEAPATKRERKLAVPRPGGDMGSIVRVSQR